jgi:uncharacterized OsmC-like protein
VLVIKRICVSYQLRVSAEQHETARRVHGFHADYCPVARSVNDSIEISTELEVLDWGAQEDVDCEHNSS